MKKRNAKPTDFEKAEVRLRKKVSSACGAQTEPGLAIRAGIIAGLRFFDEDRPRARVLLADPTVGGSSDLESYILMRARLAAMLRQHRRVLHSQPHLHTIEDVQVGRALGQVSKALKSKRADAVISLAPTIIEAILLGELGFKRARELASTASTS